MYTIAAAQMAPNDERIDVNVQRMCRMMDLAKARHVDLLAFPELALTPYFAIAYRRNFARYFVSDDSKPIALLRQKAQALRMNVMFGYAEVCQNAYYNAAMLIDRTGRIALKYRKVHLPAPMIGPALSNYERILFCPGDLGYPVAHIDGLCVGIQICYDRHFPEGYRTMAVHGADLICNLTATTSLGERWRSEVWNLLLRARAFENGVFVMGVNKSGPECGKDYYGNSMIVSPIGPEILALAEQSDTDTLLVHAIDPADCAQARLRLPFIRDLSERERAFYQG